MIMSQAKMQQIMPRGDAYARLRSSSPSLDAAWLPAAEITEYSDGAGPLATISPATGDKVQGEGYLEHRQTKCVILSLESAG